MKFVMAMVLLVAALAGCGERVECPLGHVGKVMGPNGLQDGLKHPSSFRLPFSLSQPYYLVVAETADRSVVESMEVWTTDNLMLRFDVRMTLSVSTEKGNVEPIFARLSSIGDSGSVRTIPFDHIYDTYGESQVREVARNVVSGYSVEEVMSNRARISAEIEAAIQDALKMTPIAVINAGLADVRPPDVIIAAQEAAKRREVEIMQAEAERAVQMTEADTRLQVANRQQEIDVTEAETQRLVNERLAQGVNEA